jgi:hypothetical protein
LSERRRWIGTAEPSGPAGLDAPFKRSVSEPTGYVTRRDMLLVVIGALLVLFVVALLLSDRRGSDGTVPQPSPHPGAVHRAGAR